jgi:hypothetical protein
MQPVSLSDSELDVILDLARPLDPIMRGPFLEAVAKVLVQYRSDELGPGLINRLVKPLQRQFLSPIGALRHERHRAW